MSTVSSVPNDLLYIVRLSHPVYHIQYTYAHSEYNSYDVPHDYGVGKYGRIPSGTGPLMNRAPLGLCPSGECPFRIPGAKLPPKR